MPANVTSAISLLWAAFFVGLIQMLVLSDGINKTDSHYVAPISIAFIFMAQVLFIVGIRSRKLFVRNIFAIMIIFVIIFFYFTGKVWFDNPPLCTAFSLLQDALQTYATYLLFTKSASAWFRKEEGGYVDDLELNSDKR